MVTQFSPQLQCACICTQATVHDGISAAVAPLGLFLPFAACCLFVFSVDAGARSAVVCRHDTSGSSPSPTAPRSRRRLLCLQSVSRGEPAARRGPPSASGPRQKVGGRCQRPLLQHSLDVFIQSAVRAWHRH